MFEKAKENINRLAALTVFTTVIFLFGGYLCTVSYVLGAEAEKKRAVSAGVARFVMDEETGKAEFVYGK